MTTNNSAQKTLERAIFTHAESAVYITIEQMYRRYGDIPPETSKAMMVESLEHYWNLVARQISQNGDTAEFWVRLSNIELPHGTYGALDCLALSLMHALYLLEHLDFRAIAEHCEDTARTSSGWPMGHRVAEYLKSALKDLSDRVDLAPDLIGGVISDPQLVGDTDIFHVSRIKNETH